MKTTFYRPNDVLDTYVLLSITHELLLCDARIEDDVLHMAPHRRPAPPEDPQRPDHYLPSMHEQIEEGWRYLLPKRGCKEYEFRGDYGWTTDEIEQIIATCEAAGRTMGDRVANEALLSGTRNGLDLSKGMLFQLADRWRELLVEEEEVVKAEAPTEQVWLAQLDAHETQTWVCSSERAAYECLVRYAYDSVHAEQLPEEGEIESICDIWRICAPDEYMRVIGPVSIFHFDG